MPIGASITVLVFLVLLAILPMWPYSRGWGYRPTILLGVAFTAAVVLWVTILL